MPICKAHICTIKTKTKHFKTKNKKHTNVKNIAVHSNTYLPGCRSKYLIKTLPTIQNKKHKNMKSILLAPIGLLLRTYLGVAFIMIFIKKQKAKRTERKMATATLKDAQKHAQA